jgi:SAM-dependent methyltransferase
VQRRLDMKADWDARARANPFWYIACNDAESESQFAASGRRDAARLLAGLEQLLPGRDRALEIGCGIGRLLEPLAGEFRELYGVDVSAEMIAQGRARLAHLRNVQLAEVAGTGGLPFADSYFDFCFSYITFHHIPDKDIVRHYVGEAGRVLRRGGIFRCHLFFRPAGLLAGLRERFTKHDTWRGAKFTLEEIRAMAAEAGLELIDLACEDAYPQGGRPFFGKQKPDVAWVTARRPLAPLSKRLHNRRSEALRG